MADGNGAKEKERLKPGDRNSDKGRSAPPLGSDSNAGVVSPRTNSHVSTKSWFAPPGIGKNCSLLGPIRCENGDKFPDGFTIRLEMAEFTKVHEIFGLGKNEMLAFTTTKVQGKSDAQPKELRICHIAKSADKNEMIVPAAAEAFVFHPTDDKKNELLHLHFEPMLVEFDKKKKFDKEKISTALAGVGGVISTFYPPSSPVVSTVMPFAGTLISELAHKVDHTDAFVRDEVHFQVNSTVHNELHLREGYYIFFREKCDMSDNFFDPINNCLVDKKGKQLSWPCDVMVYRVLQGITLDHPPASLEKYASVLKELEEIDAIKLDDKDAATLQKVTSLIVQLQEAASKLKKMPKPVPKPAATVLPPASGI